jgi:hypothetical protein
VKGRLCRLLFLQLIRLGHRDKADDLQTNPKTRITLISLPRAPTIRYDKFELDGDTPAHPSIIGITVPTLPTFDD